MSENQNKTQLCPKCKREYTADQVKCADDGSVLVPLSADPLIGKLFADKYEIISLLGEGGMSRVYKARHVLMKRLVALKVMHETANDELSRARFQREAEAASALSHPNVVTVYDFGLTQDGQPYFVMDCLVGQTLADLIHDRVFLELKFALEVFLQACDGLAHAQRKGVIHRDIKPSNIVIIDQKDGHELVKIVDFGIAKIVASEAEILKQQKITKPGEVFGSPAYMSPEQCRGKTLDARSDIYSFACLMYEALSGVPPLLGDSFVNTVVKQVNEKPKSFSELVPGRVPVQLEAVIMKCLEKDPAARYASFSDLKQALLDAAHSCGLKVSSSSSERKRYLLFGASMLGVLAIGFCCWFFLYPGPPLDSGTEFDKWNWQLRMDRGAELMRKSQYSEAVETLEPCKALAAKFSYTGYMQDTLSSLVNAYRLNHNADKLRETNDELIVLANKQTDQEYQELLELLKQWEAPTVSSVEWEQRAQQASAFGDRILRCVDKLSVSSLLKQERLLKRATRAFDVLNLKEGIYRTRFRIELAEIYKFQHRVDEQRKILLEAVEYSKKAPETEAGWSVIIETNLLLGELYMNDGMLTEARSKLQAALDLARAHPADKERLRNCLSAAARLYGQIHNNDAEQLSKRLAEEAKTIERELDSDEEKP
ncbi:MAG: serine/threonine protein kinase [Candidatus Obscuribacterales bacterium]|nr:serine/threonine protein kinase [Candidatus Obscuribacterales bacterium]